MPELTRRVHLYRLDDGEAVEVKGPCSLCGCRGTKWPREWGVSVTQLDQPPGEDNPMRYVACGRCWRALRVMGEMCFGNRLSGVLEFRGDAPYFRYVKPVPPGQ